jgi:glycine betaine/choline ABC-type transport system substrate-binding protein
VSDVTPSRRASGAFIAKGVDVYVDYAGTLWTTAMHRHDSPPRAAMLAALKDCRRPFGSVEKL